MTKKAGRTHVARDVDRLGSSRDKKEILEAVSILKVSFMIVASFVDGMELYSRSETPKFATNDE